MNEEVVHKALKNLNDTAGISGEFCISTPEFDGEIMLHLKIGDQRFFIEIKKEIRKHQFNHLVSTKTKVKNFMLVTEKLTPSVKEQLRDLGIFYLEANGNIFIEDENFYLWIDSNKPIKSIPETGNRSFTRTGLKLIFHFLNDKDLIQENQREIAKTAGVSLGIVPKVIDGLQKSGFLLKSNGHFVWEKREELLDKWISDYERFLKPKLFRSRYRMRTPWQEINLNTTESQWGGEPAGDILTNFLRPEEFTLFSSESTQSLLKEYRLFPDPKGELQVYHKFWKEAGKATAPPIIVYADLLISNNKRCRETANIIFDEFIRPNL